MGSVVSRSKRVNLLGFASVLTTAVGLAMGWDGGPVGGAPKTWNCSTTQHCASLVPNKKVCLAGFDGCCQGTGAAAAINCVTTNTCNNPDEMCF